MASTATPAAVRWSRLIEQQEGSGQSIREFAADNDLNPNTLAWWRWELGRTRPRVRRPPPFVELVVADPEPEPDKTNQSVAIMLDAFDARVVVDHRTDLAVVRRLLEALC